MKGDRSAALLVLGMALSACFSADDEQPQSPPETTSAPTDAPIETIAPGTGPAPLESGSAPTVLSSTASIAFPADELVDAGPPCTAIDYPDADAELVDFPGVRQIHTYGDGETTLCLMASAHELCMMGTGRSSRRDQANEYYYWGSGIELNLETGSGPFDATAHGITAVRFELTQISGRSVTLFTFQVDDPNIAKDGNNFSRNAFAWGGSSRVQTHTDQTQTADFADFKQDRYTTLIDPETNAFRPGLPLDPSKLSRLSFQITNTPITGDDRYSYCVRNLQWLGADGAPVTVPEPVQH